MIRLVRPSVQQNEVRSRGIRITSRKYGKNRAFITSPYSGLPCILKRLEQLHYQTEVAIQEEGGAMSNFPLQISS